MNGKDILNFLAVFIIAGVLVFTVILLGFHSTGLATEEGDEKNFLPLVYRPENTPSPTTEPENTPVPTLTPDGNWLNFINYIRSQGGLLEYLPIQTGTMAATFIVGIWLRMMRSVIMKIQIILGTQRKGMKQQVKVM